MSRIQVCHDFKKLSVRNIYHRLQKSETFETSYEEHAHEDTTAGSVQKFGPANPNKTQKPTQVGMTKEDVRETKAKAAQQAREDNAARKFGATWIGKFTKLGFEINASLSNKVVKKFSADSKAQMVALKERVEKIKKRLQGGVTGKGEKQPDVAECKELHESAREVIRRFHEIVCLTSIGC
jgi:hypothetical protein